MRMEILALDVADLFVKTQNTWPIAVLIVRITCDLNLLCALAFEEWKHCHPAVLTKSLPIYGNE